MSTTRRTRAIEQARFEENRRRDDERNDLIRKVQADRVSDGDVDGMCVCKQVFGVLVLISLGNEGTQTDHRTSLVFWPLWAYGACHHQFLESGA